ncbi:hypothetical protein [Virgibacillus sp. DJP39]|uniref:hypothetical protein n=1 Tax=Virgibacillus sp. DJP39 TaxID=3409790 RepID=UPI003BB63E65
MESKIKILNAVKNISGTILTIGIIIFSLGFFESDYIVLIPIGIGTFIGAGFIFLMGMFFVVSEEMVEKTCCQDNERHSRRSL